MDARNSFPQLFKEFWIFGRRFINNKIGYLIQIRGKYKQSKIRGSLLSSKILGDMDFVFIMAGSLPVENNNHLCLFLQI